MRHHQLKLTRCAKARRTACTALIVNLLSSLTAMAFDTLPITLTRDDGLCDRYEFSFQDWKEHYFYTSPTYHLDKSVKRLRFIVPETTSMDAAGGGYPCFALAEFYLYDGDGNAITLSEENFSTNAQEPSEGPIRNICDGNYGTFFHTLWSYMDESTGEHYLDVTLPTSLRDFAFGYVSRYNHVAPAKIIIDDADRLDDEKEKEDEAEERIRNHRDSLMVTVTETVKGHEWDIDLSLESSDDYIRYTAMQMDIVPVAQELTADGVTMSYDLMRDRLPMHKTAIGIGDWGTPRIVIYSMELDSIRGLRGTLIHIHLASEPLIPAGRYSFYVTNIRLTSTEKLERVLNTIEIAIISSDPDEPKRNTVIVTSTCPEGLAKASTDNAKPGERVYLHASETGDWLFKGWYAEEEDVAISDPNSPHTWFAMPDHEVHIVAVFEVNGIGNVTLKAVPMRIVSLDGRIIDRPAKGIFIVDGKKILIK